ncbi:chloride channel protein C-like [Haliotis rufescens]|uniref:chloride channel protein C-like n=1 Tax=Haliotis rufescens TaxID=6454 RepID=UPI00201EF3E8|nr:chloride channel protein C-like [Haliotis rufescens]
MEHPGSSPGYSRFTDTGENSSDSLNKPAHRQLQETGSAFEPPTDDQMFHVSDDNYGVFESGRDYEPVYVTHKYTEKEKETLASFESLDYLPSHSFVYKRWIRKQAIGRLELDRWLMMGMIGFSVGFIGFLLHQLIEVIAKVKWDNIQKFLDQDQMGIAWVFGVAYSVIFISFSAGIVVFWRPSASGSGIPEVTGFLNGTHVHHIFNFRTMIVKFLSCVAAIGCGMPVGPEGPMIHLGGLVGAGLSQARSETFKFNAPFFKRFRNSEDRRNFVSAGVAAGVSSAFGAPVGGLLFAMEEMASFWTTALSWQIFFCCMISTFTTDLFNSAFEGFSYTGSFGEFKLERYILFNIDKSVNINILMFIPTVVIGVIGGVTGALFTIINLKLTRGRKRLLSWISRNWAQKAFRLGEPALIMVIVTTVVVFLPSAFACSHYKCMQAETGPIVTDCFNDTRSALHVEPAVMTYTCVKGHSWQISQTTWYTNGTYNELASLLFGTLETAVKHLFSRGTHVQFGYATLFTAFPYFFLAVCWSSGTSVSCGMLVPMLLIGSLYGRIVGMILVSMFGVHTETSGYWSWMDPGAFALIGAASFFGGVSRLTLAVTVIMMELTNDVQVLLPVMVAVMVSKWVGDYFTHPIFHAQLELKCIPFLDTEPKIMNNGKILQLDLFYAKDIMSTPVVRVHQVESVFVIADLLLTTTHGGYPVVKMDRHGQEIFYGLITRLELIVLLMHEEMFQGNDEAEPHEEVKLVNYEKLMLEKLSNPKVTFDTLQKYINEEDYKQRYINLSPYINQSSFTVPEKFSLHRTYIVLRTLGMRHLVVTDDENRVVGFITRKDLMGFNIEEKLNSVMENQIETQHRRETLCSVSSLPS